MKDYRRYHETIEAIHLLLVRVGSRLNRPNCRWIVVQPDGKVEGFVYKPNDILGHWEGENESPSFIGHIRDSNLTHCHIFALEDCLNSKRYNYSTPMDFKDRLNIDAVEKLYKYLTSSLSPKSLVGRWIAISKEGLMYGYADKPFIRGNGWAVGRNAEHGFYIANCESYISKENWIWSRISMQEMETQLYHLGRIRNRVILAATEPEVRSEPEVVAEVENELDAKIANIELEIKALDSRLTGLNEELEILKKARSIIRL